MKVRYHLLSLIILLYPDITFGQDKFEITVAQDDTGDCTNIQPAIDACKAFPDQRIIIHFMNGVYNEKIVVPAFNNRIFLIGESIGKTMKYILVVHGVIMQKLFSLIADLMPIFVLRAGQTGPIPNEIKLLFLRNQAVQAPGVILPKGSAGVISSRKSKRQNIP